MFDKRAFFALLILIATPCQAITVATVGDSFADSLYNALRARPDLMQRHNLTLKRWSRPIIGLARTDYFDYSAWLRDTGDLGTADVCLVQIGSNDMQSIPLAKNQWIPYGSPQWKAAYSAHTRDMAQILSTRRCGIVIWILQPGFEKQDAMACHRELINELQRDAVRLQRTRVLEVETTEADYGADKTHFNRAFVLQLGPALFQMVDSSCQIVHAGCLGCHRSMEALTRKAEIFPLRSWRSDLAVMTWVPDRIGVQCRNPIQKRRARKHRP